MLTPPSGRLCCHVSHLLQSKQSALNNGVRAIDLYRGDDNYDTIVAQVSGHATNPTFALREVEVALTYKDSAVLRLAAARAALRAGERARAVAHVEHVLTVLDPSNAEAQALKRQLSPG